MRAGQDKFTWDIQLAEYDYEKYDQKGETGYNVLELGAMADFGILNCQYTIKVDDR